MTPRQSQYLEFIRSYATRHGRVPTPFKIAQELGVHHMTADRMIDSLCTSGQLEKIGRVAHYALPSDDLLLPHGLQVQLHAASERAAVKPKLLLAQIVREYCERQK